MDFDVSGLRPLQMSDTPSGNVAPTGAGLEQAPSFDISSLRPLGTPAPSEPLASMTSVAKNAGTGLLAGLPNALTFVEHALAPPGFAGKSFKGEIDPNGPTTVGEVAKRGMGLLGFDPDNPEQMPQPQNAPERIARMGGEGATGMLVPGLGVGSTVGNLALGTASGLGAGIGREMAPKGYEDIGGLLGGLAGGAAGAGLAELPSAVRSAANATVAPMIAPYSSTIRERLAGNVLSKAAQDPEAAVASISGAPQDLVPGSKPTTFQLTGDAGLGQLERAVATKSPSPFLDRRADQNEARLDALSDIQAEGHPEAVGSFFRDQLDQIDQQMQAAHDAAATSARSATEGIGGGQPTEVLGEQARTALQNSLDVAKTNERSLWKAVDPEGTLQTVSAPIVQSFKDIYGNLTPERAASLSPTENIVSSLVSNYGDTLPLQRLTDLRSVISQGMREAKSPLQPNDLAYGRLSQLRSSVEDAISDSVVQKAAQEQQAVQTGAVQPQASLYQRLSDQAKAFVDAKRARSGTAFGDAGADVASGSRLSNGEMGTRNKEGFATSGSPSVSSSPSSFIDQAAADRLKAATAATAQRKQTFGEKPVSQILQRAGTTQPYNMPGGAVSASAWKAGAGGADAVSSILKASPGALGPLKEIAASSLRAKASDGILTSKQLDAWKAQHAPALKALEKASPGSTAVFENAARAGDHLAQLAQQRKDAMTAFERSSVARLMKLDDPADVVKTIGSIFNRNDSVKAMRQLAQAASKDPAAMAGLRRAVIEHMESKLISNTEAGTSGRNLIKSDAFQTFLGKNNNALRQIFTDEELGSMRAIAQDLKRANRSIASSKLPGQSNTQQDSVAVAKSELRSSLMSRVLTHLTGAGAGFAIDGGLTGAALGLIGSRLVAGLKEAGIRSVDDLVREAMLNPEVARALLMKAPVRPGTGSEITLANRLRRVAALSGMSATSTRN